MDRTADIERDCALTEYFQAQDAIAHHMQNGGTLTYQGQFVTAQQAASIAINNYQAYVASTAARYRRDKLDRLRDWDEQNSGLWRQLWAMIRGRV